MNLKKIFLPPLFLLLLGCTPSQDKITIAAASNLQGTLEKVVEAFPEREKVQISFGGSGNLFAQIQQGAPFHLFFSADTFYPQKLYKLGLTEGEPRIYARGTLVLWALKDSAIHLNGGLKVLLSEEVKKIALPNPKTAPYGEKAREILKKKGLWEKIQKKMVFGKNVSQTAQFVQLGHSEVGLIPLSLALQKDLRKGSFQKIPGSSLPQAFVVLKKKGSNPLIQKFVKFLKTEKARKIFQKAGYLLPESSR